MRNSMPLAHSSGHLLHIHLESVSAYAAGFAVAADTAGLSASWARLAGLWHDLGKYRPGFQRYLQASENPDSHIEGKVPGREKTHYAAGARTPPHRWIPTSKVVGPWYDD